MYNNSGLLKRLRPHDFDKLRYSWSALRILLPVHYTQQARHLASASVNVLQSSFAIPGSYCAFKTDKLSLPRVHLLHAIVASVVLIRGKK